MSNAELQAAVELATLARASLKQSQASIDAAVEMREWAVNILLQFAEIAADAIDHLDHGEDEIARAALEIFVHAPQRLGIASASGMTN